MGSLEHNGGHCSYPKTPSQHFDIIKSELPNHFMRNFKIIIDHRQISSTVTTPRSKSKYVYQKFIPEFVLSLFFWYQARPFHVLLSLVKFTHAHIFWHSVNYVSYLFNCFTLLSLFRPQLFPVFLQFHCPLNQKSLISWQFTNISYDIYLLNLFPSKGVLFIAIAVLFFPFISSAYQHFKLYTSSCLIDPCSWSILSMFVQKRK